MVQISFRSPPPLEVVQVTAVEKTENCRRVPLTGLEESALAMGRGAVMRDQFQHACVVVAIITAIFSESCEAELGSPTFGASHLETGLLAPGNATDVYVRIARGALGCWFAANGRLKETHIFYAEAAPSASGGDGEIVIHERDTSQPSPRGVKVFRIRLINEPGGTRVVVDGRKLPADVLDKMKTDVDVWAHEGTGCTLAPPPLTIPASSPKQGLPLTAKG
jgi:hypothetical protein